MDNIRIIDCSIVDENLQDTQTPCPQFPMRYVGTPDCLASLGRFLYHMTQVDAVQGWVDGVSQTFLSRRTDGDFDFVDGHCSCCKPWEEGECGKVATDVDPGTEIQYYIGYDVRNFDSAMRLSIVDFDDIDGIEISDATKDKMRQYLERIYGFLTSKKSNVVISNLDVTLANSNDYPNTDKRGADLFGIKLDFHHFVTLKAPVTMASFMDGLHRILSFKNLKTNYELLCGVCYVPELSSDQNLYFRFSMDYGS